MIPRHIITRSPTTCEADPVVTSSGTVGYDYHVTGPDATDATDTAVVGSDQGGFDLKQFNQDMLFNGLTWDTTDAEVQGSNTITISQSATVPVDGGTQTCALQDTTTVNVSGSDNQAKADKTSIHLSGGDSLKLSESIKDGVAINLSLGVTSGNKFSTDLSSDTGEPDPNADAETDSESDSYTFHEDVTVTDPGTGNNASFSIDGKSSDNAQLSDTLKQDPTTSSSNSGGGSGVNTSAAGDDTGSTSGSDAGSSSSAPTSREFLYRLRSEN